MFLWHSHIHIRTLQSLIFKFPRWRLCHTCAIYALESVLICTTLPKCDESSQMKWTCILLRERIANRERLLNLQEFTPVYKGLRKFQGVCLSQIDSYLPSMRADHRHVLLVLFWSRDRACPWLVALICSHVSLGLSASRARSFILISI